MKRLVAFASTVVLTSVGFAGGTAPAVSAPLGDGSLDPSFNPGAGLQGLNQVGATPVGATTLAVQPDGKVLIGGYFWRYNGVGRSAIARTNANGSLDTTFDTGSGLDGRPTRFKVLPSGKILTAGVFTEYDGIARGRMMRLKADSSLDLPYPVGPDPYVPILGFNGDVQAMAVESSGRQVLAGDFTYYGTTPIRRLARLQTNGALDTSFVPREFSGRGLELGLNALLTQPGGKVLVGGFFTAYSGVPRSSILRVNANGSLDRTFNPGSGLGPNALSPLPTVLTMTTAGESVFLGGVFGSYNGSPRGSIVKIHSDGSLDPYFAPPSTGFNGGVNSIAVQPDGRILVAGNFDHFNGAPTPGIARLLPNGRLDHTFKPGTGFDGSVTAMVLEPNGTAVLGGYFTRYNGIRRNGIVRIIGYTAPMAQVPLRGCVTPPKSIPLQGLTGLMKGHCTTNAGQTVSVRVTGALLPRGDLVPWRVVRGPDGAVFIRTNGYHVRLKVTWAAPATWGFKPYSYSRTYTN